MSKVRTARWVTRTGVLIVVLSVLWFAAQMTGVIK